MNPKLVLALLTVVGLGLGVYLLVSGVAEPGPSGSPTVGGSPTVSAPGVTTQGSPITTTPFVPPPESVPTPTSRPGGAEPFDYRASDGRTPAQILARYEVFPRRRMDWPWQDRVRGAGAYSEVCGVRAEDQAVARDKLIELFFDEYVGPNRRDPKSTPRVEDWPKFSRWLRDAEHVVIELMRRDGDVAVAMDHASPAERQELEMLRGAIAQERMRAINDLEDGIWEYSHGTFGHPEVPRNVRPRPVMLPPDPPKKP